MVRYFLTDLRGNPIYSFAQRRLRNRNHRQQQQQQRLLSHQLLRSPQSQQEQPQERTFATTTLVCMIRNQDWNQVLKRVATHETERLVVDVETGNTVLHLACRLNPPPTVIAALAAPSTCRHANREGATPLHMASSHRCSASSLRALLDACQRCSAYHNNKEEAGGGDAASTGTNSILVLPTSPTADLSRMGRAPIHYACMSFRGLEMDAFRLLLDATLKEGNLWVNDHDDDHRDDDDDGSMDLDLCYMKHSHIASSSSTAEDDLTEASCGPTTLHNQSHNSSVWVNVMGLKDATGQTPLALLFRRYRERVRCVITTVDRLRQSHQDHPDRAALVAAVRVHADLGELWEKARWIVARLTEERLQREVEQRQQEQQPNTKSSSPPKHRDATSRRATYYGGTNSSSFYDSAKFAEPPSPVEAAKAHAAASWAVEQHPEPAPQETNPYGAFEPRVSTNTTTPARQFRIVHASVGLTGYGCPPELIRLAISIHPHQIMEMDEDGNLPLHIAVTAASFLATAHAATDHYPTAAAVAAAAATVYDNSDDHSVLSDAAQSFFSSATVSQTTNPFDKVMKILLEQYPEAARMPQGKTGRLPLVLAIESGRRTWEDGIRTLLHAYPPSLHNKKIIPPYLYPNVLALVANNGTFCNSSGGGRLVDFLPVVGEEDAVPRRNNKNKKQSKRALRQETCSRTTLFELLRTNSAWATHGFDLETDKAKA